MKWCPFNDPSPFLSPPSLIFLFPLITVFSSTINPLFFHIQLSLFVPRYIFSPVFLPKQSGITKTRGARPGRTSTLQTWVPFYIMVLQKHEQEKKPSTAPVSVPVSAVVWAQPPVEPPDFTEQRESRLSGTLRFDSHREWRSLSPQLVSFHFRSVSVGTKTCLLILKTALRWYVQSCSELSFIPASPNTTQAQRWVRPQPALSTILMSLHIISAITHTIRVLLPQPLAHLMCAFNVFLTRDTTDLNPMTEPNGTSTFPTCTEAFNYSQYTAERWHMNVRAVVAGHCGCMDQRIVNIVTQRAVDLLLHACLYHSHARFPLPK